MRKIGYVFHPDYLKHVADRSHPESPQRLLAIEKALASANLRDKLFAIEPEPATKDEILWNHSLEYYQMIEETQAYPYGYLDIDTFFSRDSFQAAILAVGGVLKAGRMVMEGKLDSAFCAVRPPGHHAEYDIAMGFCLFNNIAILAHLLLNQYGLQRIAILDWDVHHGNGTQHSFYESKQVHYSSVHQFPFYPGSGLGSEIGAGAGRGFTLNFPLPAGSGDELFVNAISSGWSSAMRHFKPEIVLISAGFDAHKDDHLASLEVTNEGFMAACREARKIADEFCEGKIVSVLEGGYNLRALGECVKDHIKVLME